MRKILFAAALAATLAVAPGCRRKINGPGAWWDDQARQPLPDTYRLPDNRLSGTPHDPAGFDDAEANPFDAPY